MKVPILSEAQIEERANEVLADYGRMTSTTLAFPIPIEKIAHKVLDLPVEWESLVAIPGRKVVSKFSQATFGSPARIVLNSDLIDSTFRESPGLESTAIAHEAGHGVFHMDRGRAHQLGLGFEISQEFVSETEIFTNGFLEVLGRRGPVSDDWWREWQAHTFMRYVLMPRWLLMPQGKTSPSTRWNAWSGLYDLREHCNVTISAVVVHLSRLGFIRVDERKVVHDVSPMAVGQHPLRR